MLPSFIRIYIAPESLSSSIFPDIHSVAVITRDLISQRTKAIWPSLQVQKNGISMAHIIRRYEDVTFPNQKVFLHKLTYNHHQNGLLLFFLLHQFCWLLIISKEKKRHLCYRLNALKWRNNFFKNSFHLRRAHILMNPGCSTKEKQLTKFHKNKLH